MDIPGVILEFSENQYEQDHDDDDYPDIVVGLRERDVGGKSNHDLHAR